MKRGNKNIYIALFLCMVMLCSGCWDNRDITELSIVSAVGIDKAEDGQYELSVQIIKTSAISAREQGSMEEAVCILSKTGDTVFEAVRNLLSTVGQRPLFSHAELLVIGEDVARDGVLDVLDFFERDHETRRRALVLIAKGISAKEVMGAKSESESIPAVHLAATIETVTGLPKTRQIEIIQMIQEIGCLGKDTVVGVIHSPGDISEEINIRDLEVGGGAVFKGDRLIGWIEPNQMRGYLVVVDEVKSGIVNVPNPQSPDDMVAIEIKEASCKRGIEFKDGDPVLVMDIKVDGNIGNQEGPGNLTTPEMVEALTKEYQQAVTDEVKSIVSLAQKKFKCDIFGFGEIMHKKHMDYWNTVSDDWDTVFSDMPVQIDVEATILKPGLIKYPTQAE